MSDPIFFEHPCGMHLSITQTDTGVLLSAYNPETGRALYGFEETTDMAIGWAEGARDLLFKKEGLV